MIDSDIIQRNGFIMCADEFVMHRFYIIPNIIQGSMSFNSHRRNFSLLNTRQNAAKQQSRSLRKINHANPHYWIFVSAKQHYNQQNSMQAAIKEFELYLEHNPTHLQSLYLCAVAYMHLEFHKKAIQKLVQYLTLRKTSRRMIINSQLPSNSSAYLLLAIAYTKIHAYQKSLEAVNQALASDAKFVEGYCLRAKILSKLGENKRVYSDYLSALKCDSKCLAATMGLGDYYSNIIGNFGVALKYYVKAKEIINEEKQNPKAQKQILNLSSKKEKIQESWNQKLNMNEETLVEIELKQGICLFQIEQYDNSIKVITRLLNQKRMNQLSELYFYLGMSQLKRYEETRIFDKNKKYQTLQYVQNSDFQQAILNLQYSVKTKTNSKIVQKAAKALIRIHMENYQFYDASNVVELIKNYEIEAEEENQLCEACMEVIKHKYEKAKIKLKKIYEDVNKKEELVKSSIRTFRKNKPESSILHDSQQGEKGEHKRSSSHKFKYRKSLTHAFQKKQYKVHESFSGDLLKNSAKMSSIDHQTIIEAEGSVLKKQEVQVSEYQWMKPIIFLFSSYSNFFSDSFIECLEDFQLYEAYIKDYLGEEPQNNIYLAYNKTLCEGILMMDNQMIEQSLQKFSLCLDHYYRLLKSIPAEPILFKIVALLKLSLSDHPFLNSELDSKNKILLAIIDNLEHYRPILQNHYLAQYYHGLILLMLDQYQEASDAVQICLKNVQQCQWKFLYVKGVIQIRNQQYKTAIKQFSAGLLLEEKAQLYLGRCVSYLLFYEEMEEKNSALIQKSFEDLQKYIELENDKQKISVWVTKILFFNRAYEESSKSLRKCEVASKESDEDLSQIERYLNVYEGNFEDGGVVGRILMNAFEGKYQKDIIEVSNTKHEIAESDFITSDYRKWLMILNFYIQEQYKQLIKLLQRQIFEAKDSQNDLVELKYNLFVAYLLSGEFPKAKNVMVSLQKFQCMQSRARKFLDNQITIDECLSDLQEEFKGVKRLSSFLPYRKINYVSQEQSQQSTFFIKISLPFPSFPKPNIAFTVDNQFLVGETSQTCIPKKIEAPWVKKVTGKIQFTDVVIESMQSSILIEQEEGSNKSQTVQASISSQISSLK